MDTVHVVAAVLSTLHECSPEKPVAASSIYMALGMDMGSYQRAVAVLRQGGLAKVTSTTIQLTDKGRGVGAECSKILAEAKLRKKE